MAWVASPKMNTRLPVRYVESTEREYQGRRERRSASHTPSAPGCSSAGSSSCSTLCSSLRKATVAPMPIGTVQTLAMPNWRSSQLHTGPASSG